MASWNGVQPMMTQMKNDKNIKLKYLSQYYDIYGENLYLSPLNKIEESNEDTEGGVEFTAFYHLIEKCNKCNFEKNNIENNYVKLKNPLVFINESKNINNYSLEGEIGDLFDKILFSIDLNRNKVFILDLSIHKFCNVHLLMFLKNINPLLVVILGEEIAKKILKFDKPINYLSNKNYTMENINFMLTHHPREVFENSVLKKDTWINFKRIRDNFLD